MLFGGGQEKGYRPGTENTCMIAGLGKAAELIISNINKYTAHMTSMCNYLELSLSNAFPGKVYFNVKSDVIKLPNTLSVAFNFDKITGEKLLSHAAGISASTGAACHTGGKSSILLASGVPDELVSKSLRLSVGRETSKTDIDNAIETLKQALEKFSS
ncbi:Selenocysteine lyase, partial [Stegodyphus mimosarum]